MRYYQIAFEETKNVQIDKKLLNLFYLGWLIDFNDLHSTTYKDVMNLLDRIERKYSIEA